MASLYVPPEIGETVIDEVARKQIPEVWLNPGADREALVARARALKIQPIVACSIVAIGQNPYAFHPGSPQRNPFDAGADPPSRSARIRLDGGMAVR